MNSRPPRTDRKGPALWVKGIALSISVAVPVYLLALMAGFTQVVDTCQREANRGADRVELVSETFFPPSKVCHWSDGTTLDLVPVWATVVLYLCAALFVVCAAAGIRATYNRRKHP